MITNTYIAIILYTEFLSDQSTNFPKFIYYLHSFSDITQTFKLHNYLITVNNYERFLFKTPKPNAPATPASPKPTTAASLLSFSPICGSVAALASAFGASAFLAIAFLFRCCSNFLNVVYNNFVFVCSLRWFFVTFSIFTRFVCFWFFCLCTFIRCRWLAF